MDRRTHPPVTRGAAVSGPQPGATPADTDTRPHPIHQIIRREALRLRSLPPGGYSLPNQVPELAALLQAALTAVEGSTPAGFEFYGRRYFLRVRMAVQLEVFDEPAAAAPLVVGASLSEEGFGHVPGH